MSDFILDATGAPIGTWRANQDPSDVQRVHEVPKTNAKGEAIVDEKTGEPTMVALPLDDPRVAAHLEATTHEDHPLGLRVEGNVIVAIEGPAEDAAPEVDG